MVTLKNGLGVKLYKNLLSEYVSVVFYGFDLWWLIGQSNMIGRSAIRAGIDDDYSAIAGKVYQFGYNSQTITPATNPLDHVNENAGQMGMWLEFVKAILPGLAKGRRILLVPCAQGDTSLASNWSPGQAQNNNAKLRLAAAMASGSGINRLAGVLWHQGEGDSLTASEHRSRIQAMYDDFISSVPGMSATTPFICGSITSILQGSAVINASLQDFAAANDAVRFVDLSDLPFNGDNIHYTNAALFTAGQRYGAAVL